MQAHTQSSPAARAPSPKPSPDPQPSGPTVASTGPHSACPLADSAGLAHDAGNLLAGLRLYCDLLDRPGVLAAEHRHYAAELRQISARSSRLIERLLGLASAQPQPPTAPPIPAQACDPAAALHELAPLLRSMVGPGVTIDLRCPERMPAGALVLPALTAETLERIVVNLVCNSAKALATLDRPGRIGICLRPSARSLRLIIQDDGPGLEPDLIAAFPAPQPPRPRSGLGHRIVDELARASGAQLHIASSPGRGTTFTLQWNSLPFTAAPLLQPRAASSSSTSAVRSHPTPSGPRASTASEPHQQGTVRAW
jgi:signal transduction histidine kinase